MQEKMPRVMVSVAAVFAVVLLFAPVPAVADAEEPQILIINTFGGNSSPYLPIKKAFKAELQKQLNVPISFHELNLEANRGIREDREEMIVKFMHDFYGDPPLDLVVAFGPPAVDFWLRHRHKVAGQIPLIASAGEGRFFQADLKPGDAGAMSVLDFTDLIDNILVVKPSVSHIVMIFGSSDYERSLAAFAKSHLGGYEDQIKFEYTNDYSFDHLRDRLTQLDESSAVLYGMLSNDISGLSLGDDSGLPFVRNASRVPVFGALDEQMGDGIVGGRLLNTRGLGVVVSNVAATLIQNPRQDVIWRVIGMTEPIYDWREVQAFGIDPGRLPGGSVIRYKLPTFWDEYGWWLLLFATVLALQSFLIAALWIERGSRRRAEKARANVAGKLITAHEDERRHISRELHDDLSQRLVRLSIDAVRLDADEDADQLELHIDALQKDIKTISKDLHDLSYRLHPSILEYLGIEAALKTELQHIGKHSEARVLDRIGHVSIPVSRDAALCIYRIAQAALHNALSHAQAGEIEVRLKQDGNMLSLVVSDDGTGFRATNEIRRKGLGLSSMHERAKLLGGRLQIESAPGRGTTISALIPSEAVNP